MKVVYGTRGCVWWDTIDKVGMTPPSEGISIPCCPYCGSILFEVPSEQEWWNGVDKYEANGHPGYRALIEWSQGVCFSSFGALKNFYEQQTGRKPPP